jgi:hypothetical protein
MIGKYGRSRPYYGGGYSSLQFIDSGVLNLDDFTDVSTTGYVDVTKKLPAGAIPLGWKIDVLTPFTDALSFAPADGTKIALYDDGSAGHIFDFTGMPEYVPVDTAVIEFVDGGSGADTITDSEEGFDVLDLEAGDRFYVTGTDSNDKIFTVVSAAAGTITLATAQVTAEEFTVDTGTDDIRIRKINDAATGGFVADGLEDGDALVITGLTTAQAGPHEVASSGVKAGYIKLGNTLTTSQEGKAGVAFSVAATTTATVSVGVSTDPDRFSADNSQSVATAGKIGSLALAAAACDGIDDAQTIRITVTETTDFTSYDKGTVAGSLALHFFYIGT